MKILSNGVVRQPNGRTWIVQRPLSGDGPQLRAYMEGTNGFSLYGITEPTWGDSAWSKVLKIGQYVFQRMYWTGTDQISSGQDQYHTLYILNKVLDANPSLNSSKGPTFACQTIGAVMSGILTAYGVVSRLIMGATQDGGNVDVTIEVFVPDFNKWVWWHAPTNGYVLLEDGITPASSLELKYYYSNGKQNLLTYKSGTNSIQLNTGYERYGINHSDGWWAGTGVANAAANLSAGGFFYKMVWRTSSGYNYSGGQNFHAYTQVDSTVAIDTIGQTRTTPPSPIYDLSDVFPTFNVIQITKAIRDISGFVQLDFDHSMIQFDRLQISTDNINWTDAQGLSVQISQFGTGNIYIRGIDVRGVPSNIVQIAY